MKATVKGNSPRGAFLEPFGRPRLRGGLAAGVAAGSAALAGCTGDALVAPASPAGAAGGAAGGLAGASSELFGRPLLRRARLASGASTGAGTSGALLWPITKNSPALARAWLHEVLGRPPVTRDGAWPDKLSAAGAAPGRAGPASL